jgi:hypothetical protein
LYEERKYRALCESPDVLALWLVTWIDQSIVEWRAHNELN